MVDKSTTSMNRLRLTNQNWTGALQMVSGHAGEQAVRDEQSVRVELVVRVEQAFRDEQVIRVE